VKYRPLGAALLLRRNLLIYGLGGILIPFAGIKLIRPRAGRGPPGLKTDAARCLEYIMTALFRPALVLLLALTLITGVAYPLVVTGIAQAVFPSQAGGSILIRDGKTVGSRLIGQSFSDPKHFWSRPFSHGAAAL